MRLWGLERLPRRRTVAYRQSCALMQPRGKNAARPHHGPSRNDARGMGGDDHEGQNAGFAVDEPERGYDKYAGLGWAEKSRGRAQRSSYMTHKVRGTLGVHTLSIPRIDRYAMPRPQSRDDGRERTLNFWPCAQGSRVTHRFRRVQPLRVTRTCRLMGDAPYFSTRRIFADECSTEFAPRGQRRFQPNA